MLNQEQINGYHENGFIVIPGLLTKEEAALYRRECHELADRLNKEGEDDATWGSANEAVATAVKTVLRHCHDVQFYSAAFSKLIVDARITDVAAHIMGTPNVQLHHTKMFIKPAEKGSPFPMHQDVPYFPHDNHSMIAAIIHFDDAPLEKGCLRVIPGSHKKGPLEHETVGGYHLSPEQYPVLEALPLPAKAGDVVFFSYLTVHGSGVNESSEDRTTLLIQMRDPEDVPTVKTHESRGQGMMLRGINPTTHRRGWTED